MRFIPLLLLSAGCAPTITEVQLLSNLDRWQTLISGLAAVAAASVSVFYLRRQISQADKHENERREARHAAARATLPLTLGQLLIHLDNSVLRLTQGQSAIGARTGPAPFTPPQIQSMPADLLSDLRHMIEVCTEPSVNVVLANIISQWQVLEARANSMGTQIRSSGSRTIHMSDIHNRLVEIAIIHALAASLYDYARRLSERPDSSKFVSVFESLKSLDFSEHSDIVLFDAARRITGSQTGHLVRSSLLRI